MCLSSRSARRPTRFNRGFSKGPVHQLMQEEDEDLWSEAEDDEECIALAAGSPSSDMKSAKCALEVNGKRIVFQLDTGASVNLLPLSFVPNRSDIVPSKHRLRMWNNSEVHSCGTYSCRVRNPRNNKEYLVDFVVVKEHFFPLLGFRSCVALNLLCVKYNNMELVASVSHCVLDETIFSDAVGKFPGKVKLRLNQNIVPVISPPRKTPLALKAKLKDELNRLMEQGIIVPVTSPTEWVNQFVLVPKPDGSVRLCIDPVHLNKALLREHYTLPTFDDVVHELAESDTFTKCDIRWGFLHVELDEDSSYLTTFQTPFGRFRWCRMPFGICVAPEIFQRKVHEMLEGLSGVIAVADDIIIHGKGETEHDTRFQAFLDRCVKMGVKLNRKKLEYKAQSLTFLGHCLSRKGIAPDPAKTAAIKNFPCPQSVTDLKRFLGMVTFLGRYVPQLAHIAEPLHNLLKSDVPWCWSKAQDAAFKVIKDRVVQHSTLAMFNEKLPVLLECDASEYGLGSAMYQEGRPIAFASRTLTPTERRYAQIEKEMLAVVTGLEKFHHFIFGRHITVHTDHKPLVAIVSKPLYKAPKRLQSLLLRAKQYSFDLLYVPGKLIPVADALSRAPLPRTKCLSLVDPLDTVLSIHFLPVSDTYVPIVQHHTSEDPVLQQVKHFILEGWPDHKEQAGLQAGLYFPYRDELAVSNGIIMRGDRIVVPSSLRQDLKKKIHAGHQGINACLGRARQLLFWPGMSAEIRQFVEACPTCAAFAPAQIREPMIAHDIPPGPWLKLGADIFELQGRTYLVVVDYFSKFIEVDFLTNTCSSTVIHKLKHHFARHGIPRVLVTDGGPQFTSTLFSKFSSAWNFTHKISSPGNSRSNGQAEAAVKSVKSVLRKCALSGEDPYLGLLALRNTADPQLGSSPVQRLFGRATRTNLPTSPAHLEFSPPSIVETHKKLLNKQNAMAHYYDKSAKNLPQLKENMHVLHRNPLAHKPNWERARLTKQLSQRTYELQTDRGTALRRNRRFLKMAAKCNQENPGEQQQPPESAPMRERTSSPYCWEEAGFPSTENGPPPEDKDERGSDPNQQDSGSPFSDQVSPANNQQSRPATQDMERTPAAPRQSAGRAVKVSRFGRVIKPPCRLEL